MCNCAEQDECQDYRAGYSEGYAAAMRQVAEDHFTDE